MFSVSVKITEKQIAYYGAMECLVEVEMNGKRFFTKEVFPETYLYSRLDQILLESSNKIKLLIKEFSTTEKGVIGDVD